MLGRGLRDDHFLDLPGSPDLRRQLVGYFLGEPTLEGDLNKLFGEKMGPHGPQVVMPARSGGSI